ncbi:MAG: hypothetical protein JNJ61_25610 [Anaerolineae bacterium]|nr:hypothetical protein [Anaerolineae bacterium]
MKRIIYVQADPLGRLDDFSAVDPGTRRSDWLICLPRTRLALLLICHMSRSGRGFIRARRHAVSYKL